MPIRTLEKYQRFFRGHFINLFFESSLMGKYRIVRTEDFKKKFKKLPLFTRIGFEKQMKKVAKDPYAIGKPLGRKRFRELKNKAYRAYFIIVDEMIMILFIDISKKKDQKRIIQICKQVFKIIIKKGGIENVKYE